MARRPTERVIVFVDWQNVYKGARDAFHHRQAPGRPAWWTLSGWRNG
jgi:hypothetical protein